MSTTQHNRIFSEVDVAQLIDLFSQGIPVSEIARVMERPQNNVRNKVRALQAKGKIPKRATSTTIPEAFIADTADTYNVPLDVVATLALQTTGPIESRKQQLVEGCIAWSTQSGNCFYSPQIALVAGVHPAGATIMRDGAGNIVLVCRAIARMRGRMSHNGFVNLCHSVSNQHRT